MWLTKDERRILTGYYHSIGTVGTELGFRLHSLAPALATYKPCVLHQYGAEPPGTPVPSDREQMKKDVHTHFDVVNRVRRANELLAARGLIEVQSHQHEQDVVFVSLTISGYDLGRKYALRWTRTGLWFSEHKDHWVWLLVGFLGGILGSIVIKALDSLFDSCK